MPRPGAALRALLATVEIVLGTLAAHTWAGGTSPSAAHVAAIAGLVFVGSLVVLRGAVRAAVAVPALAAAQLLLHCWLVALSPGQAMPGHGMPGHPLDPHHGLTTPMLAAHLAAAVLTAVVWGLRERAVDVVIAWGALVRVIVPTPRLAGVSAAPRAGRRLRVVAAAPRRGPPRPLVLA